MTKKDMLRGRIRHIRAERKTGEQKRGFWRSVLNGLLMSVAVGSVVTAVSAAILMATPDPLAYAKLFSAGILFIAALVCAYVAVRRCGKAASGIVSGALLSLLFFSFAVMNSNVNAETAFIIGGMVLFSLLGSLAGSRKSRS